ncbi:HEAT repeat protein [Ceratobasidium sp. AG-Ba]|nr:HEAT repeat protein [Ceratobasidium sp. AG-Ba]
MSETDLQVDEGKISGENGEIYLLQWLSSAEKALHTLPVDTVKAAQADTERVLLKAVAATPPFPVPGRPIRALIARSLLALYARAETRSLYDAVHACLKIAGETKVSERDARVAALHVVGEIMAVHGSQLMSFAMEVALIATRIVKSSSNSILLRTYAFQAAAQTIPTAGKAITDNATKDLAKQLRACLADKSMALQRAAAETLLALHVHMGHLRSPQEIEQIITICVRSFDTSDKPTRRALSRLIGSILASTQTPVARPAQPTKKSAVKKDQPASDDENPAHGATTLATEVLAPDAMLNLLATQFHKPTTHRRARIVIAECYAALFAALGRTWIESHYATMASHLFSLLDHPRLKANSATMNPNAVRYERLLVRQIIGALLRQRTLSERGQIAAVRTLSTDYLSKWPAVMPGTVAPSPDVLVACLREIAALLDQLGNAPPPVQDALADPLTKLVAHPRHAVQVAASWTLRAFCNAAPNRLAASISAALDQLQKDVSGLGNSAAPPDLGRRAVGRAKALAALLSLAPARPLYVSGELAAKVLECAVSMLKRSGEHPVSIAGIEVECAWGLISALTALGATFVRGHLPSLLALWRNAVPKAGAKDVPNSGRSIEEWGFLLHVRGSAVGALVAFLESCGPNTSTAAGLVTLDVGRRLSTLLTNALSFANAATSFLSSLEFETQRTVAISGLGLSLRDLENILRARTMNCFALLGCGALADTTQSDLIRSTINIFAGPGVGNAMQAAIATAAGGSLGDGGDGYAWGLSSFVGHEDEQSKDRDSVEEELGRLLIQPILGSLEHNPLLLCSASSTGSTWPQPPPPATAITDAAITLFSSLLPLQEHSNVQSNLQLLVDSCRSTRLDRNAGRKTSVMANTAVALAQMLRIATEGAGRKAKDSLGTPNVVALLGELLQSAIVIPDPMIRSTASEALGRLAALGSTNFLTSQIKYLVDQVVVNRDPDGRAGCALAFGAIYSHVGGLAAGPLLKTTVNVLMSLGNDPHPIVHYHALKGLARVIDAANLSYSPYIANTLGMLCALYLRDSHEPAGGTTHTSNLAGDLPAYELVCQIIDALIGVLGPELQEPSRTQSLILDLVREFSNEPGEGIAVEAIKCSQHVLMFASPFVDVPALVERLRANLFGTRRPLKLAAINALYQLVQKDALVMSKVGGDKLVEDLFGMLDDDPTIDGVRNVISSWLHQTVTLNPSAWIDLCQRIMARTTASQQVVAVTTVGLRDEESEGLGVGTASTESNVLTSRWRTQLFALQCLHNICALVVRSGQREHLDIRFAKQRGVHTGNLLVTRVHDLIKMAFTASAAYVTEIRLEGLIVLRDVIQTFALSPDPDYEESLLLEQHQAPITAALTPAFSGDSTPDVLATAIRVCAVFVGSGLVKEVARMGRILKLLTTALEQSKEHGLISIGEIAHLGPNASVMLRISTLTAWAELEVARAREEYLEAVLQPYRQTLCFLWVSALRDYSSIRADSEVQQDGTAGIDLSYIGLGRETLLPFYEEAWLTILSAVGFVMKASNPSAVLALDGLDPSNAAQVPTKTPRTEPVECFFIILGLVYEALAAASSDSAAAPEGRSATVTCIQVLAYLVRPEYAARAILDRPIFDELVALWYRMSMTESWAVQTYLVGAIVSLVKSQKTSTRKAIGGSDVIGGDTMEAQCLRLCITIIKNAIPSPQARSNNVQQNPGDRIPLLISAFQALLVIGEATGPLGLGSIRVIGLSLYADLLRDEYSDLDIVGPTLQALRGLILTDPKDLVKEAIYPRVINGLLSLCLQNIDEMSGRASNTAALKIKNNMLAASVILTASPEEVKISRAAVEHCCFLISHRLSESAEGSLVAAQCLKTLVSVSSNHATLQFAASMLIPGALSFLMNCATEDEPGQVACLPAFEEVLRAIAIVFNQAPDEHRPRVLGALLPPIVCSLQNESDKTGPVHVAAVKQVLSFATSAPAAFKEVTGLMGQGQRAIMEKSLRQAIGDKGASDTPVLASKPQIALRSF